MLKKRMKSLFVVFGLIFGLTGCSKEVKQGTVEVNNDTTKEEKVSDSTSKVVKENGMIKTPIFTNKKLDLSGDIGGVKYNFNQVQISDLQFETEEAASTFDVSKGDEVTAIVFNVDIENTLDKDVSFYIDQSELITNTKQQVSPNMLLSGDVGGDLLGKVKKDGDIVYILKNTKAQDLKTLELRIGAPIDANTFDSLGEDVKLNLNVN